MINNPSDPIDPEAPATPPEGETMPRWWLVHGDQPEGPHSGSYIAVLVKEGQVAANTLVCKVGTAQWTTLSDCDELVQIVETQNPGSLPPQLPASARVTQFSSGLLSRFTNPALPRFANLICVYCLLVIPSLLLIDLLTTFGGFSSAAELVDGSPLLGWAIVCDFVVFVGSAAVAVTLFIGGYLLRRLRKTGVTVVIGGIVLGNCWLLVVLLSVVHWESLVLMAEQGKPASDDFGPGAFFGLMFLLLLMLVYLACFVFELVALVWLVKKGHSLPLEPQNSVAGSVADDSPS
jgi:hypothetical protein